MESAGSAEAVLQFAERQAEKLVLVGHSPPLAAHRATGRALKGAGPGILPYLAVNHLLPPLGSALRRPRRLSGLCRERGIRTLRLAAETEMQSALRETRTDLLVSFHLDRILGAAVLAAPARGGINVHPSLLPRHRGPVPSFFGLAEGVTGVSVHALAPRIDAGGIWAQRAVALPAGSTALSAARALHLAALPLLDEVLDRIAAGEADPAPPTVLPYRGWPAAPERRRAGVRMLGRGDLGTAWRAPAGGWRT